MNRGYVRQLPTRRYALGPKLIRLGESATQLIGAWSRPHLSELVRGTGETANMAVLDGTMAVYVAQVPSEHAMRMFTEVGRRVYPHCTGVGKAILMQLSNDAVRSLVGRTGMTTYTENSLTDPDMLIADLELSRNRGFAIDEGEQEIASAVSRCRCRTLRPPLPSPSPAPRPGSPSSRPTTSCRCSSAWQRNSAPSSTRTPRSEAGRPINKG